MNVLLMLLCVLCAVLIMWGLLAPNRLYRFPFLFGVAFIGFALPQMIGLSANDEILINWGRLPEQALDMTILMSILSIAAMWVGDGRAMSAPQRGVNTLGDYDSRRLILASVTLTGTALVINNIGLNLLDRDYIANLGNQWSGPITIIMFLVNMQKYGHGLALLMFFYTGSPLALITAISGVVGTAFMMMSYGRRGAAIDMLFLVLLSLWFTRRVMMPAWLLGMIFVAGALWSNAIGAFRGTADQANSTFMEKLERVDLVNEFTFTLTRGGHEIGNAAMIIWCANNEGEYDFGKVHWNQLVHAYFPGQIFGHELKKALKLEVRDLPKETLGYVGPVGVTTTGMSDAFASFWYFGCIKFFIIGYVMGRWYNRAMKGDIRSQLAYMTLMGSALHTVSHGTSWLLNNYIHMVIFSYPLLWWSWNPKPRKAPPKSHTRPDGLPIDLAARIAQPIGR